MSTRLTEIGTLQESSKAQRGEFTQLVFCGTPVLTTLTHQQERREKTRSMYRFVSLPVLHIGWQGPYSWPAGFGNM